MAEPGGNQGLADRISGLWANAMALALAARAWGLSQAAGERGRWALWLPVGLGAGAAIYFQAPFEIPFWGAMAVAAAAGLALGWRAGAPRGGFSLGALAILLLAAGIALAGGRTERVAAPMIFDELGPVFVEGRVVRSEVTDEGFRRLTIAPARVEDLSPDETPAHVRLTVRQSGETILPGAQVEVLAVLLPPSGPAAPGAFDFARAAYFDRLGAVGYSLSAPRQNEQAGTSGWNFTTALARLRHQMSARIRAQVEGSRGGIAAALITGDRSGIADEDIAALRASGLAHLLAISGLHMALVGGLLFLSIRILFSLREVWALTRPIKKWAAAAALVGAFAYLLLSGGSVSTQRAFIMIGVAFVAVMCDRPVLTMRTVAVAALAVLILAPESVTQVGFQMSFAAVMALIALSEWLAPRLSDWEGGARALWRKLVTYVGGLMVTSLVAGMTIAPFAAYHFNRFSNYEVAANLIAMPVMAFWVMPWAIVAVLLMPLGLDGVALVPMAWGIDVILGTAHTVSAWPGAEVAVPAVAPWVLAILAIGGLWIVIWQRPWRWAGLAPVALALIAFPLANGPDVLIHGEGETLAIRDRSGEFQLLFPNRARYEQEIWLRRDGDRRDIREARGDFPCDNIGCTAQTANGRTIAYSIEPQALVDDCQYADILVTPMPVRIACQGPQIILDRRALRSHGAHSLTFVDGEIVVQRANDRRAGRPWVRPPES